MDPLILSGIVLAVVFMDGVIGLQLQRTLPEDWTTGGARDMTGAVVGLVTLLLALVLGLLIWSAYGVYSTQRASIQTFAINGLKFDEALQEYGPEAAEGRQILRKGLKRTIAQIWGGRYDGDFLIKNYSYSLANVQDREAYLNSLEPATDKQRTAKADASRASEAMGQTRLLLAMALIDHISYPLIAVVVAWATCLFCGYGLLSKRHPMSYITLGAGTLAIASAIYSIADLSSPYSGLFVVSPAPIMDVFAAVDAAAQPAGVKR